MAVKDGTSKQFEFARLSLPLDYMIQLKQLVLK